MHDAALIVSFAFPIVVLMAVAIVAESTKSIGATLTALITSAIVFVLLMMMFTHSHVEHVPREDVTFVQSPSTLYVEYQNEKLSTEKIYPYKHYKDTSKVQVVMIRQHSVYGIPGPEDGNLDLHITREGGNTNALKFSR